MAILHTIVLVVALAALTGISVSFLGMVGIVGRGRPAGGEDYDNPYLFWFLVSIVALLFDGAAFSVAALWDWDRTHIAAIAAGGLVVAGTLTFLHRLGITPGSWWSKLVPSVSAAHPKKPWWLSKTMIFNAGVAVLLLAENNVTGLQGLLPASKYQIIAFVLPIVNLILRAYTTKGLSLTSTTPQAGASQ